MDQDLGVRQRHALARRAARQEQRAHAHRHADADRRHVGLDELHRVVDRQARVHRAAGRVDVERDVLVGVLALEVQQLGDDQVGDLVVDRRAEEDDPLVEQPRVDVEASARRATSARRPWGSAGSCGGLRRVVRFTGVAGRPELPRGGRLPCRLGRPSAAFCAPARASTASRGPRPAPSGSRSVEIDQPLDGLLEAHVLARGRPSRRGAAARAAAARAPGRWPRRRSRTCSSISSSVTSTPSASAIASTTSSRRTAISASGRSSSTICSSVRPVAATYCSNETPSGSWGAVCWRIVPTRRSTITAGTSTVAFSATASMHHAPEQLVHLRPGGLVEAALDVGLQLVDGVELAHADGQLVVELRQLLLLHLLDGDRVVHRAPAQLGPPVALGVGDREVDGLAGAQAGAAARRTPARRRPPPSSTR